MTDGLSNTVMFYEIASKQGAWYRNRDIAVYEPATPAYYNLNSFYGDWNVARHVRGLNSAVVPNVPAGTNTSGAQGCSVVNVFNANNPFSFHSGGIQTVRGDGSVAFMNQNVSNEVFVGLLTRNGGEVKLSDE